MALAATETETINVNLADKVNEAYWPLLYDTNRYRVVYGGAGSGKSIFVAQSLVLRGMAHPKQLLLCVRNTASTLKHTVVRALKFVMGDFGVSNLWAYTKPEGGHLFTYLPNGNEIIFMGLDDTEKIKSLEGVTVIWGEEGSEITRKAFGELDRRLRGGKNLSGPQLEMWLSLNPIDVQNWINKDFFEEPVYDGVTLLHTTYKDNRFLDDAAINVLENLKRVDANQYRVYAQGLWGSLEGLVFGAQAWADREWPTDGSYDESRVVYGVDFGFNHPSAVVRLYIGDDFIHFDEILYETGLITADLIAAMKAAGIDPYATIYCDSAEPDRIEEMQRDGFYNATGAKKGKGSIRAGIDYLKSFKTWFVTGRTVGGRKEKAAYKWPEERDGTLKDVPVDAFNHFFDASRYGAYTRFLAHSEFNIS